MKAVKSESWIEKINSRDFPGLMDIYERNFNLLNAMLPDLEYLPDSLVSRVSGTLDLHLRVLDRCKYTTTVLLTYYFPIDDNEKMADPDLTLKIYWDTGQAEALACKTDGFMSVRHSHHDMKPFIDCRWESNMFVEKWLQYSLKLGHVFSLERLRTKDQLIDLELF